jgi:dihydroorotate dehydrogenase electron transfer subunit
LKQILARVISDSEVMPGIFLIWLEAPQIAPAAKPGQFVMVNCGEETFLHRPLSIHQVDQKTKAGLALLFAVKGKGTHWLLQRQKSDNIDLIGPMGNGFSLSHESQKLLLVAGGIGIAPLCFLAQEAVNLGHSVKLLLGAVNASKLYTEPLLPPGIEFITATEDGSAGKKEW